MQRRLTDDERSAVSVVMFWQRKLEEGGITASGQEVYEQMLAHNTTDGRPYVEPPLTDEDARQRPWIMVRDADTNPWNGPFVFICKTKERWGFAVTQPDFCELQSFRYARRATPDEIAAAGLEVTE
jgi:hypothetical protein